MLLEDLDGIEGPYQAPLGVLEGSVRGGSKGTPCVQILLDPVTQLKSLVIQTS